MNVKVVMDAKELKKFINAISVIVEETPIMFDQDGLRIETLDPIHVSMISAKIPKGCMQEYSNDGFNCFALDIRDLAKFCKNIKGGVATITATADNKPDNWATKYKSCFNFNETEKHLCGNEEFNFIGENGVKYQECTKCKKRYPLELFKCYDNIKLVLSVENGSRTEITVEGYDYKENYVKYPELKRTGFVTIDKRELQSAIKNFMGYGDYVKFNLKDSTLIMENDKNVRNIYCGDDVEVISYIDGNGVSSFYLNYLKDLVKGISSKYVKLELTDDAPISIKDAELDVEYILAPRVERN
jgi:DNA polymerase III sliding clamp (beta) subunit (PCNA family)